MNPIQKVAELAILIQREAVQIKEPLIRLLKLRQLESQALKPPVIQAIRQKDIVQIPQRRMAPVPVRVGIYLKEPTPVAVTDRVRVLLMEQVKVQV